MRIEFSSDAKGYRRNLADSLKEKRKEDPDRAKELLQKERETLQYQISVDIKNVLAKIEAGGKNEQIEMPPPKEISVEEIKITGSDGTERRLEVHTQDISNQIPESVKLVYDMFRLAVLDTKLSQLGFGVGKFKSPKKTPSDKEYDERLLGLGPDLLQQYYRPPNLSQEDWDLLKTPEPEPGSKERKSEKWEKIRKINNILTKESYKIYNNIQQEYSLFLNTITEGAFENEKVFTHIVAPFGQAYGPEQHPEDFSNRQKRFPHINTDSVEEQKFDVHTAKSDHLWFNAGGSTFGSPPFSLVLLCDSQNKRLLNEVKFVSDYGHGTGIYNALREMRGEPVDAHILTKSHSGSKEINNYLEQASIKDKIEAAAKVGAEKDIGGIVLMFKRDEPWLYICDWIVDSYHGRIYKIIEKKNE